MDNVSLTTIVIAVLGSNLVVAIFTEALSAFRGSRRPVKVESWRDQIETLEHLARSKQSDDSSVSGLSNGAYEVLGFSLAQEISKAIVPGVLKTDGLLMILSPICGVFSIGAFSMGNIGTGILFLALALISIVTFAASFWCADQVRARVFISINRKFNSSGEDRSKSVSRVERAFVGPSVAEAANRIIG